MSDRYGIYGFFAPAGCPLDSWIYASPGFDQHEEAPRLLVQTRVHMGDFVFNRDLPAEGVGGGDQRNVRFTYRPLSLLARLTPDQQVEWDWSDIGALGEASFQVRLLALRHSIRCLLDGQYAIIPEILDSATMRVR